MLSNFEVNVICTAIILSIIYLFCLVYKLITWNEKSSFKVLDRTFIIVFIVITVILYINK